MNREDTINIMNALHGIEPGSGNYTCAQCMKKFEKLVELRYHKKECLGAAGQKSFKTSRFSRHKKVNNESQRLQD